MLIEIPTDSKVTETPSSIIWFDDEGILFSVGKPSSLQRSMEQIKAEVALLRSIIGDKKVCIILESNNRGVTPPKEQRDAIAREMDSVTKALAVVSSSPLARMMANLFFSFKPPKYPMRLFSTVTEARNWVRQYL